MNTVIACGGTGGHLFPGLAVAEVLAARGHQVIGFISEKEIDTLGLSGRSNFQFEKLPTIGLPSPFSPAILGFLRRFTESLALCRTIYRKFKPHVILGMGGFTSTAPVLAGKLRGVPTFIHESNAIPGKANRLTARMVRAVLLGFKEDGAARDPLGHLRGRQPVGTGQRRPAGCRRGRRPVVTGPLSYAGARLRGGTCDERRVASAGDGRDGIRPRVVGAGAAGQTLLIGPRTMSGAIPGSWDDGRRD